MILQEGLKLNTHIDLYDCLNFLPKYFAKSVYLSKSTLIQSKNFMENQESERKLN